MVGPKGQVIEEDEEPDIPPVARSFALSATADFLLFIGILFILLGAAAFVTDFLKIKGIGEVLVGVFLVIVAMVLLARSRRFMPLPAKRVKKEKETFESYR